MKRFSWKIGLVLVATFALGGVAGGFAMKANQHKRFGRHFRGPPSEARQRFLVEAMTRRLDLTQDQQTKVRAIFEAHRDERRAIFEQCRPAHEALRGKIDAELAEVLTPEQQTLHRELRKKRGPRPRH